MDCGPDLARSLPERAAGEDKRGLIAPTAVGAVYFLRRIMSGHTAGAGVAGAIAQAALRVRGNKNGPAALSFMERAEAIGCRDGE
jgi:hypothetical protein